jgi:GPH family glycoside/pentoside/hexuronide:cation symporter
MTDVNVKLSVKEKIGYSLGDLSANLIFQTFMTFLAFYYTDVYKIAPGAASAIIFTGGMIGAFFNPIMGMIADRTQTRWGKFRPWILWTAVPFGIMTILAFTTPDFKESGKIAYAMITYTLLVLVYSANNLPYAALSGVLTGNIAERNSISSYRFVAVMVAQFIVQVLALPLVMIMGDGDKAVGFKIVMTMFACIGIVFFIITFLTTKERVIPKPEQKSTIREDLGDLFKNRPWIVMLVLTVLVFITLSMKGGTYVYYFKNYVDEGALQTFLQKIGFNWEGMASDLGFSIFNAGGIIFMIVGIAFSKRLADKFGKRDVFGVSLFLSSIFLFLFVFYPPKAIAIIFITQIFHGFFYGLTIPLLWAMIADVADYSEWKNNRRATAIIFSAMIFGLKMGLSVGGAMVTGLLGVFGYNEALAVQPDQAVNGIKLLVSVFPTITFLIGIGILFFYPINKKMEVQIENELTKRRKSDS